jgi:hypothetical protein
MEATVNVQREETFVKHVTDGTFAPVAWRLADLPQGSGRPCVTARGEGWQERRGAANPNARLSDAAVAEKHGRKCRMHASNPHDRNERQARDWPETVGSILGAAIVVGVALFLAWMASRGLR